ncbi:MAG: thioredoxin-like domain-containing protein, partial [Bacteroidota bacterium]
TVTNLSFNDVFNKGFKLYEKLDKPVLIEIWSMNCQQCKRNKKYLKSFYTQYNIDIISICTDDYPNEIRKMAQQNNYPWSTIHDDSPKFNQGASFSEVNDLGAAKFILLTPDKQVYRVYNSEKAIGKVGVDLQQYFSK